MYTEPLLIEGSEEASNKRDQEDDELIAIFGTIFGIFSVLFSPKKIIFFCDLPLQPSPIDSKL